MKATIPLMWISIVLALTLLIIAFMISPLNTAIDESIELSVRLNVQEMSGIINILQTSPDGLCYKYYLPKADCRVDITSSSLRMVIDVRGSEYGYGIDLIQAQREIEKNTINCMEREQEIIYFYTELGKIRTQIGSKGVPSVCGMSLT